MAKTSRTDDLLARLHVQGLRKRTAKLLSEATDGGRKPAKGVERRVGDIKALVAQVEDRLTGAPERRKTAAKQAAASRRLNGQNARRRSESAKRAPRTGARGT
jgi:hypothetical protein